jgi:ParB family chromosome partitioning protein
VWENRSHYQRSANYLRQKLTERDIEPNDPDATFVGLEAYEQAGGAVRRDLFSREPTAEQQAQLDALQSDMEALEGQWDALGPDDDDSHLIELQDQAEARREAITDRLSTIHPGDAAIAGAVVHLDRHGEIAEARGLVRREDRASSGEAAGSDSDEEGCVRCASGRPVTDTLVPKPEFSERLLRQLTAHRTAAMRVCLADDPGVALRVLAYQLATLVFYAGDRNAHRLDRPVESVPTLRTWLGRRPT